MFSDVRTGDLAVDGRADEAVGTNVDLATEVVSFGSANNDGVIAGGDVIPRILEVIVLLPPHPAHLTSRPEQPQYPASASCLDVFDHANGADSIFRR